MLLGGKSKARGSACFKQLKKSYRFLLLQLDKLMLGKANRVRVSVRARYTLSATTVVYEGYLTRKGRDVTIWKKKLEKALVCIAERFEAIVLR